jgi:hypothetical protein
VQATRSVLAALVLLLGCGCAASSPRGADSESAADPLPPPHSADTPEPPWTSDVILWHGELGNETPWRDHPGLKPFLHSLEYPDDAKVAILRPIDETWEIVWVRVIGYHPASGEFLGRMLNQPHAVPSVSQDDNIAFRFIEGATHPVGIDRGSGYARSAYPSVEPDEVANSFIAGLRRYRLGNLGHNPDSLVQAIPLLEATVRNATGSTSYTALFYTHFYLGRCHAELYNTREAIYSFEAALEYRPVDPNANMGLLAEYSIMALSDNQEESREFAARFDQQEARIRELFLPDSGPVQSLDVFRAEHPEAESLAGIVSIRWKAK